MTNPIVVLILSSAFALNVHGQEQKQNPLQDSSANKTQTFDARSLYPYPVLSLPLSFKTGPEGLRGFLSQSSSPTGSGYVPGFLRLSLASPLPPLSWESHQKLSLASCWRNELLRQEEYETFRMIIGSIQMGGAAYLAYKHIKKYGLK
ncbi:MAG: hypothetical protein NTZ35_04090 [Ignavibacteriales bacterium]|nr:hypothetical protein [Ignavibacteriales bacterium]